MNEAPELDSRQIMKRLVAARKVILLKSPFFGTLIMQIKFALGPCETACTDMRRIIWDPSFVARLTDEQIVFVMLHEIMHCCLNHCQRGRGKNHYFYNVATDIVVNSNILQALGFEEFEIDGENAMHIAPDGREGRLCTAEEIYAQLMDKYGQLVDDVNELMRALKKEYGVSFDEHDIWQTIPLTSNLSEEWKEMIKEAAKTAGNQEGLPTSVRTLIKELDYRAKLNWKDILHDFICIVNTKYDFDFVPPDRRFSDTDFLLPAFELQESEEVENIWFVVDTSGSISNIMLSEVFEEIKSAISQFEHLSASISLFDTSVTEPVAFESVEELNKVSPQGGGGTSFYSIFRYMKREMEENLPTAVVILTDGYATYPPEDMACGVPVLWILVDQNQDAPWGVSIHLES